MLTGHDGAGPVGRGPRDPGADPPVRRRRADPVGGPRRGARGSDPRRRAREASSAREGPRPVRDEHAEGARRRRVHDAPAGPRLRADRSGDERARLVRAHAAGVGARRVLVRAAGALDRAGGARRAARVLRDHRGGRGLRRRRDRLDRPPRRGRLRAERHEDARDLVQHRRLDLLPGQARRRRPRGRARAVLRRQGHAGRPAGPRASLHAHLPRLARAGRVRGRAGPGRQPRGRRRATGCRSPTSGSGTSG